MLVRKIWITPSFTHLPEQSNEYKQNNWIPFPSNEFFRFLTEATETFLPPTPYSYSLVLLNPSWTLLLRIRWGGKWLNQPIQGKWRKRNRGSQEEAISIDRDLNLVGNRFDLKTSSSWFSSTFSHPLLPWLQCMEGHVVYNVLPLEAKLICWFINHLIQKAETPKQEATILLLSFFLWLCLSSSAINFVFVRVVPSFFRVQFRDSRQPSIHGMGQEDKKEQQATSFFERKDFFQYSLHLISNR